MIAMKHNKECIVCQLIHYGLDHVLIEEADIYWCANQVAYLLKITFSPDFTYTPVPYDSLYAILDDLLSIAVENGVIHDSIVEKDILDTWNELQKSPFDRSSAQRQIMQNNVKHPEILFAIQALPTTVVRPFDQVTDSDIRYNLSEF